MATSKPPLNPLPILKRLCLFAWRKYRGLHFAGKLFIWLVILFYIALGVFVIIVTPATIAQYLYDHARLLAETRWGWLVLEGALILISFPPLIGHTTLMQLCGFAYGMKGFYIAASGSVIGSALAFTALRFAFSERLRRWSQSNEKWQALESVVRAKGLSLIILIRVSPFPPWVYSTSLFASIEPVALWQFVTATFFIFPKIALHVFIGSRIASLSDGDQRGHMDTQTKILNAVFVIGGFGLAIFSGWLVYSSVQTHIRHLEGISPEVDELAAEAIEEYGEEAPLLRPTSPTSVEHV